MCSTAQHSTNLSVLRLTVLWITNSLTYNGHLVRNNTMHPLFHIQFTFLKGFITYGLY